MSPLIPSLSSESPHISTAEISRAILDHFQGLCVLAWVPQEAEPEIKAGLHLVYLIICVQRVWDRWNETEMEERESVQE